MKMQKISLRKGIALVSVFTLLMMGTAFTAIANEQAEDTQSPLAALSASPPAWSQTGGPYGGVLAP